MANYRKFMGKFLRYSTCVFIILILTCSSMASAEESWTIKTESFEVVRSLVEGKYILTFYKEGKLYGIFYQTPHGRAESGYQLQLTNKKTVISIPDHFTYSGHFFVLIRSENLTQKIELGNEYVLKDDITITKYGNLRLLNEIILTPAGYAFIISKNLRARNLSIATLIAPTRSNYPTEISDKLRQRVMEALLFLSKFEGMPIGVNIKIDSNAESASLNESAGSQLRSSIDSCEPVPECCCKPEDRAPDGQCYKPTLLVAGAWGDTSGYEDILNKIEDLPCMKNTRFFGYDEGSREKASLDDLAADAASDISNFSQECGGSPVTTHGYCYGGHILAQAMKLLENNRNLKYSITTYNTAYDGVRPIYPLLNALSLGIVGFFQNPRVSAHLYNNIPRPGDAPENVTSFKAHVSGDDHAFDIESQKKGPNNADYWVDEEGTHHNTLSRNFEYIMCCGDGAVEAERGEECEAPGSACNSTGLCGGLPIYGTCSDECKCNSDFSSCSDVFPDSSPSPFASQVE
jgi:hypothetical protein